MQGVTYQATKESAKEDQKEQWAIQPTTTVPAVDTSTWPLLLKNYDKLRT
jgi:H/ACA ribonucleoprotein complex subunit 4